MLIERTPLLSPYLRPFSSQLTTAFRLQHLGANKADPLYPVHYTFLDMCKEEW